ncbi:hypothetical protein PCK1_001993 [Pneumocystis canis]|nr:hypothetical protein PCK1_001993 [Pneumocystis canis]
MYSFEGNYKLKRTVNLGGKQKESKELFLKKVANYRKKRDDERRRHNAALLLQKVIRSKIAIKHANELLRYDFDHDILEYKFTLKFSENFFLKNIRRLIFFYQVKNDFHRLYEFVEIIQRQIDHRKLSFFEILSGASSWIVRHFGHILIKNLNYTNDDMFHTLIFQLLPDLVCFNVSLVSLGYYKELRLYICKNNILIGSPIIPLFISAVITPLRHFYIFEYSIQKVVLSEFVIEFFVLTKIYGDIVNSIIYQLGYINFDGFSKDELLWILHNVLLYLIGSNSMGLAFFSLDEIDLYSRCISGILIQLLKRAGVFADTYCYDYDFDNENIDVSRDVSYGIVSEKMFFELNLSFLFSADHITKIITYVFPSTVTSISKLLVILMEFWPSKKSEIMTQLVIVSTGAEKCRNKNMLLVLWETVKIYIIVFENNKDIYDVCESTFFSTWTEQWYNMILLFELYSWILITMADDEFFDFMRDFIVLDDIRILVDFLKDISYLLYSRNEFLEMHSQAYNMDWFNVTRLRNIVTKLIQLLFIRASRRQIFSENYWLLTNRINITAFVSIVISQLLKKIEKSNNDQDKCFCDNSLDASDSCINILQKFPFYIPFSARIYILQRLIDYDMEMFGYTSPWNIINRFSVIIRRNNIFEDGFAALYNIGNDIKKPINIIFVDQYGIPEVGIDGGGLTKEFLVGICRQALDINFGLFHETHDHLLYPNPHSYACEPAQLQCFEFLGRLIGKCIYETILLDVTFAPFFLTKLLGGINYVDDLLDLDPELYKGLMFLKRYTGDVENDFSLNFTIIEQEFGKTIAVELIPDGSNIPVTTKNRLHYIYAVADYRLNKVVFKQTKAFVKGLSDIIDIRWLSIFTGQELQNLIGGSSVPIDIDDLRKNTVYGGFQDDDFTIELFWSVLYEFHDFERRLLLKFVTSVSRPPLLGFKDLKPLFCIQDGGYDTNRLPTASTCINLLILPRYNDKVVMKSKLLYVISFGAGFDLV